MRRLFALLAVLAVLVLAAPAHAAVSEVSEATAYAATVAMPTHAAGDLLLVWVVRRSATPPTVPDVSWLEIATPIQSSGGTSMSGRMYYKIAASGSETTGTWTNGEAITVWVLRGADQADPIGGLQATVGDSNTFSYAGITMDVSDGTSWVIGACTHRTATGTSCQNAPTGMTNYVDTGATAPRTGYNAVQGTTSWSVQTVVASASHGWNTVVFEVKAATGGVSLNPGGLGTLGVGR
jgi:hypothetical protein